MYVSDDLFMLKRLILDPIISATLHTMYATFYSFDGEEMYFILYDNKGVYYINHF